MIVKIISVILVFLTLLLSTSCKKDKDTEKPLVNITSPYENQMYVRGGQLNLNAGLSDNEDLAEYKIDIHKVSVKDDKSLDELLQVWDTTFANSVTGKTYQLNLQVHVPELADVGQYQVLVTGIDKEGNEGSALKMFKVAYSK